jgi:hypothetical protein
MKKILFGVLFGIFITVLLAFKTSIYEPNNSTAEVNKIDGYYIFTDSKPVLPFEIIDSLEIGFITDTQYESIKRHFIKKAKNKYQYANGLIINLNKKGVDKCLVIKLKESHE